MTQRLVNDAGFTRQVAWKAQVGGRERSSRLLQSAPGKPVGPGQRPCSRGIDENPAVRRYATRRERAQRSGRCHQPQSN